ncbi:OLC1v1022130C1 [Oldenlandia corymbosa var. corymbosa]|uniref:starch synthase n=1 Tax=Oldenlandia corymbosa var. corymbosa TaxID=529605 RepID=A0AAV1BZI3_OLDCO|nr:OLC1v1022130C1 [Oldenlandia corymbosa var. corymbosa]
MESSLATCFLSQGCCYGEGLNCKLGTLRFYPSRAHRFLPASCKMRHRSSQNKRYQTKKMYRPARANLPATGDDSSGPAKIVNNSIRSLKNSSDGRDKIVRSEKREKSSKNNDTSMKDDVDEFDALAEAESRGKLSDNSFTNLNSSPQSVDSTTEAELANNVNSLILPVEDAFPLIIADAEDQLSSVRLEDLIGMIRNAQRNIHLLNHARIRALDDLERIADEKEGLQAEINSLVMKLAETDARLRVASQQKVHVELLEDQLEKLQNELSNRGIYGGNVLGEHSLTSFSDVGGANAFSEEFNLLKMENSSLKNDLNALKSELSGIKGTEERVQMLEKERLVLQSALSELQSKLAASEEDVAKLSTLKSECKSLDEKVEDLQKLLDKATKQADQAIFVLQENQELRKKVDKLEQSLEEANVYKLSSERLQHFNDLMHQKLKILEERLQKSDEEIHGYVQLYQDSVKEFQDTLDNLKEESKKKAENEPVNDMPWEFWSQLLLMIDAWLLEKKISTDDGRLLRELVWKRDGRICNAYLSCKEKKEDEMISTLLRLLYSPERSGLHVIHIAAEMAPVAKVGGLGDVVTGLGKALQQRGHLVEVILPKYDCMQYELIKDLRVLDVVIESFFDGQLFENRIWTGTVEGLPVYFIEPHHPGNFFWRGQFYGERDDFKRFSFFSRAALELILQAGKKPDIIHCHDWQTAFVAPLYWDLYAPKGLNSARICFTCHNFEYQGTAPAGELGSCGLDVHHLNRPDRMQDNSSHDRVNPIKGAIVFSNIVTTVSPTYAQEVRTAEGGKGLHSTLNTYARKFVGVLNGIDTDAWNPASDTFLKVQYSAFDIDGKAQNKEALKRKLGLSSADVRQPLVGCITRLVPQKGVHLIRHALYRTLELGGQFVLLGSSPVPHIQREFEDIANQFQNHEHARLLLKYDESLSRLIYAASDMLIIPSIFEPCGLTQMIAMRYGTIPIARKTGGLNDSVFDVDDDSVPEEFRNGFTFFSADEQGFNNALERAFSYYRNNGEFWQQLVEKVMKMDFSWNSSAATYEELYEKAVSRARAANRAT